MENPAVPAEYIVVSPEARLRTIARAAEGQYVRGTFIVATGRAECCEKYFECATALRELGFNTVIFDWRGQGLSTRMLNNPQKGHVESFDEYIVDLEAVVAHAHDRFESGAIYILAHSMGGHIALRAMARRPELFKAAILSAPMIDITSSPFRAILLRLMSGAAVRCGLGHNYIAGLGDYGSQNREFARNILTHDPVRFASFHEAIAANPDLAVGGPTWGWLQAALISIARGREEAAAGRITSDVLIVSAGDERVVNNQAQMDLARHLPNGELVSIPASWHEILQETQPILAAFWEHAKSFLARYRELSGR